MARAEFEKVFSRKDLPDDIPVKEIAWEGETMKLIKVMTARATASSNSEARRLVQQGGVEVNQQKINDVDYELPASASTVVSGVTEYILRVGKKRFVKIVPKK